jgi:glutaredoxin 3
MKTIEIYGQKGCGFCSRAVEFCQSAEYAFVYRDIADAQHRSEMFARNPQAKTVPQIFVGDTLVGGFDDLKALPTSQLQQMIGE